MVEQTPAARARPSRTRRVVQGAVSLLLVVAIFYFVFKRIDLAQMGAEIRAMTWLELTTLGLVAVWNLATYAFVWMSVTPGLSFWRAMALTQSSTAVANTLPAGAAVGIGVTYAMLGSWGYSRSRSTLAVLVSGVWNSFVKLGLPVLALALLALQGNATPARIILAAAGIAGLAAAVVVFAAMLRSERGARRVGVLAGRAASWALGLVGRRPVAGWEVATGRFRARTVGLLGRRWHVLTAVSLVSHLSLWLVLLLCLRHVGVANAAVGWAEILAVFAFARLATAIPFTPGGLGVVEGVLIGGLTAAGGDKTKVAAAVVVYRALTWLLPIPVGAGTYLWWRRRSWTTQTQDQASPAGGAGAMSAASRRGQARTRATEDTRRPLESSAARVTCPGSGCHGLRMDAQLERGGQRDAVQERSPTGDDQRGVSVVQAGQKRALITAAINWSDAIFALPQVSALRGDTVWAPP